MGNALPPEQNFLGIPVEDSNPATAGVVVLSAPYEATSTYGKGSCEGPGAIIEASRQVELFDAVLGIEPYRQCGGIATIEALECAGLTGAQMADRLEAHVQPWLERGKFVVVIGGEHTSIIGSVRAHVRRYPDCSILHLDAHSDFRQEFEGNSWNHACAATRMFDFHDKMVQVGIRSQDIEDRQFIERRGVPCVYAHEINGPPEPGWNWMDRVLGQLSPQVYISLDCDVLDPSIIPATGTPEPGGLNWYQLEGLLACVCREREVVGLDVTELSPIPGHPVSQYVIAKLITRFLGYRFP